MPLYEKKVTALIGPSGCGKSTYLRCFNRMRLYPQGYDGDCCTGQHQSLHANVDPIEVRMCISMVFQKPNFPKSIYENVAYGLRGGWTRPRSSTRRWSRPCAAQRCGTRSSTA